MIKCFNCNTEMNEIQGAVEKDYICPNCDEHYTHFKNVKAVTWKKCTCGYYHCPSCGEQIKTLLPSKCPFCGTYWKGNEEFNPVSEWDLL